MATNPYRMNATLTLLIGGFVGLSPTGGVENQLNRGTRPYEPPLKGCSFGDRCQSSQNGSVPIFSGILRTPYLNPLY